LLSLAGLLLTPNDATAQGQSPTSPFPRPGIPDQANLPSDDSRGRVNDGASRFSNEGRFSNSGRELAQPADSAANSPVRRSTDERPAARAGAGLTAVSGGAGRNTGPGLVTGALAAPGGAAQFVQGPGVAGLQRPDGVAAGNGAFDVIFEREVEYPPLPDGGEVLIDLSGPKSVSDFLDDIRIATLWNILISESVRDRMLDFWITEATPQQAMEILKFHDLYYEFDAQTGYLYVMSVEEWQRREFGKLTEHKFVLKNADLSAIAPIVTNLLSSAGRMIAEPATRQIRVWDTPDNLALLQEIIPEIDVPLPSREFPVEFAEFGDVEAALSAMLSPVGRLLPDSRTSTIIVWDQPNVLSLMEDALGTIDVPVLAKTFYLEHVLAIDTIEYLEVMVSERGLLQVDPRKNSITVKDLPGRVAEIQEALDVIDQALETRTWVVDYADLEFLADTIEAKIPPEMGEIVVNEEVHQITVSGIPSKLDEIDAFIKTSDVQRKQVQIEAFIVEVGADVEREFNINWSYFGSRGDSPIFFDAGSGFTPDSGNLNVGQLPYSVPLYGALELDAAGQIIRPIVTNIDGENVIDRIEGNNLAVTLDYLDQKNKATVLSSPRVAVQDGEEATFENATQVPFVSSTTFFNSTINNLGNTNNTNRVEFIDVGTILKVLPRITTKNNILLDINAEDSTFVEVRVLASDQASTVPQKTVRRAETQLRIQSGDTVVLGGLRRDRAGRSENRTPILGDLPGIGRLFRYPNKSSQKSTLLIFITPTIVDEFTDPHAGILAEADAFIASEHRHNQKNLWGRLADRVSRGGNEITVAVGQSGDIHAEGERATLEELGTLFREAPAQVHVVLRRHPRSPETLIIAISDLAMDAGRSLEFDEDLVPLVPRYPNAITSSGEAGPAPSAPPER